MTGNSDDLDAIDPSWPPQDVPAAKAELRRQLGAIHGALSVRPRVAPTIAALRRLAPLPGRAVLVLGYHVPGDGGGGLFFASDRAEPSDGGLAFGALADESEAVAVVVPRASFHGFALPHQDLVFGSVEVDFPGPVPGTSGVVLRDLDLHGHRMNSGGLPTKPLIDHKAGMLDDQNGWVRNRATNAGIPALTVRYRYFTSPKRWVRVVEDDALRLKWFGAVEGQDARDRLCWALNAAARLGLTALRLDGSYRYRGTIELPDGLELTDGTLTVADGGAVAHYRLDYAKREPAYILGGADPLIVAADGARSVGLRRVELDGNWRGNREPWDAPSDYDRATLDHYLHNSPAWNGFVTTNHSDRAVPEGQRIVLDDVHIHGFGGNCLLGHANARWHGRNVRLGDSLRAHLFYGCDGEWHGLTLYGFWRWGGMAPYDDLIFGLRVEGLAAHPFGEATINLLGYRGLDYGDGSPPAAQDEARQGFRIDGFRIDLAGATFDMIFGALGRAFSAKNGIVLGNPAGEVRVFQEFGNGYQTGLNAGWELANIVCVERGHRISLSADKNLFLTNGHLRNITIQTGRGYAEATDGPSFGALIAAKRGDPAYNRPQRLVLDGVIDDSPRHSLLSLETQEGAAGIEVSVRDSLFRLTSNTVFQAPNGSGTLASLPETPEKIRVYFERCTFIIDPALPHPQNRELFLACSRFRACTAWWDSVGEDAARRWGDAVRTF